MANILNSSIVADLSGKVGNLVYSRNQGGPYVRAIGTTVQPFTDKQIDAFNIMTDGSEAWQLLTDFEFSEWSSFTKRFFKTNRLGIKKAYTPRGFFLRCYAFRRFADLTGNPQPIVPEDVGFEKLTVSRTGTEDYNFTIAGGSSNSDFAVLYKTNQPYSIGTRSINTTQQVFFHFSDYVPDTVNLRTEFDVGFPTGWPTLGTKRFWASCQIIHKASGVCVGEDVSSMTWPVSLPNGTLGISHIGSLPRNTARSRAIRVIPSHDGIIQSLNVYKTDPSGTVLLGVYDEVDDKPFNLLGITASTVVSAGAGFVKVSLLAEVSYTANVPIWLATVRIGGFSYAFDDLGLISCLGPVIGFVLPDPFQFSNFHDEDFSLFADVVNSF